VLIHFNEEWLLSELGLVFIRVERDRQGRVRLSMADLGKTEENDI
jgi:hypothetical protein